MSKKKNHQKGASTPSGSNPEQPATPKATTAATMASTPKQTPSKPQNQPTPSPKTPQASRVEVTTTTPPPPATSSSVSAKPPQTPVTPRQPAPPKTPQQQQQQQQQPPQAPPTESPRVCSPVPSGRAKNTKRKIQDEQESTQDQPPHQETFNAPADDVSNNNNSNGSKQEHGAATEDKQPQPPQKKPRKKAKTSATSDDKEKQADSSKQLQQQQQSQEGDKQEQSKDDEDEHEEAEDGKTKSDEAGSEGASETVQRSSSKKYNVNELATLKFSSTLFVKENLKRPFMIVAEEPLRTAVENLVRRGGHRVVHEATSSAFVFMDKPNQSKEIRNPQFQAHDPHSIDFIIDSCRKNKLQVFHNYRIGSSRGSTRLFFTESEDEALIEFANKNDAAGKGQAALWFEAEKQNLTIHTWQSMKERYNKHLKHRKPKTKEQESSDEEDEEVEEQEDKDKDKEEEENAEEEEDLDETQTNDDEMAAAAGNGSQEQEEAGEEEDQQEGEEEEEEEDDSKELLNLIKEICPKLGVSHEQFLRALLATGDLRRAVLLLTNDESFDRKKYVWTYDEDCKLNQIGSGIEDEANNARPSQDLTESVIRTHKKMMRALAKTKPESEIMRRIKFYGIHSKQQHV